MAEGSPLVVMPLRFEGSELRIYDRDGAAWFIGKQVAELLGYAEPHKAVSRHCKGGTFHPSLTGGGEQMIKLIPEADVYRLIMKSKLPAAERFERWVAEVVLPTLRRTGSYTMPGTAAASIDLDDPTAVLQLSAKLTTKLAATQERVAVLEARNTELQPKAAAWERLADTSGVITLTTFAKSAGVSPKWLASTYLPTIARWCYRREGTPERTGPLIAYQTVVNKGWMTHRLVEFARPDGSTGSRSQVYLTPAGAANLAELIEQRRQSGLDVG